MKSSAVHLFAGSIGVVIRHHLALVEIGRQRIEAGRREAVAHALDLVLQPHHSWITTTPGALPRAALAR